MRLLIGGETHPHMHLSVQTLPFDEPLEDTFKFLSEIGIQGVDINCSEYFSPADIDLDTYLDNEDAQAELLALLDEYDLRLDVLGATNNPLHPNAERQALADGELRDTIRLAAQLDVDTVTCFSGVPGGTADDTTPNWLVSPIPPERQQEMYDYQWEEVAIPYWQDIAAFADDHDVDIAIELHLNMLVHGPLDMLRLRESTNDRIGGYIDPGHLLLQQIDVEKSIRCLSADDAIHHFEASDVKIYESNRRLKGVLDMTPLGKADERSWLFCTVGYGHGEEFWRDVISTLDIVGYDGAICIQQLRTADSLHGGIEKAAALLDGIIF